MDSMMKAAVTAGILALGTLATAVSAPRTALAADPVTIGQVGHLTGYGAEGFGRPTNWGSQVGMNEVQSSKLLGATEINLVSLDAPHKFGSHPGKSGAEQESASGL